MELIPRPAQTPSDISAAMLERAETLPGGKDPRIRWILGSAEDAAFDPPYALAIAGDALHWMTWETVIPRVQEALAADAFLAIVTAVAVTPPWFLELQDVIRRYSVMQNFEPYSLVDELQKRHLFEAVGDETVGPEPFPRSVAEYIDALHATSGFPRERMGADDARLFDDAVQTLVAPFANAGVLELGGSAQVIWGRSLG
ncbi:MAG: class I SAM-dependent methyltransferase [Chloroflexota bacterium]|nr:class I SAM-dependent methyltransferase [Chloroflexota bacterium]